MGDTWAEVRVLLGHNWRFNGEPGKEKLSRKTRAARTVLVPQSVNHVSPYSAEIVFRRQNLTSVDVGF